MESIEFKTTTYTEESWRRKHKGAPLPLEAYKYPIWRIRSKRTKKQEAALIQAYFNMKYDKKEQWKPTNPSKMTSSNLNNFRWIPGAFPSSSLPLTAKAIYPVMCCRGDFEDFDKEFQVSKENIGAMAGITSWEAVDDALFELKNFVVNHDTNQRFIHSRRIHDKDDRRYNVYKVWFPRRSDYEEQKVDPESILGGVFMFHRSIIESGIWAELTLRQKVFWMGLRAEGELPPNYDEEIRFELGDFQEYSDHAYKREYARRDYDVWAGSRAKLLSRIGIKNVNIYQEVVKPLEDLGMIKQLPSPKGPKSGSIYKVFLVPDAIRKEMELH